MVYEPRTYRRAVDATGLVSFEVVVAETDLMVSALTDLTAEATRLVKSVRSDVERYVARHPRFLESLVPIEVETGAPAVVRTMAEAARTAGVGPMAAVAGAVAEYVARGLHGASSEVIVENGGDLYLIGTRPRTVLLLAGDSPLSGRLALEVAAEDLPLAVCTSSGRVGHSASFGSAHAATVLAREGALADAAATAVGNRVHGADDVGTAARAALDIPGVRGVVVIADDRVAAAGDIRLVPVG